MSAVKPRTEGILTYLLYWCNLKAIPADLNWITIARGQEGKKMLSESSPQLEDKSNILRFDVSLTYTNVIIASEKVVILIWNRWEEEPSPLPSAITEAVQHSA